MKKLLTVILIAALALSLTACGGSKPEDAVKGFLDSLKKWDVEAAGKYVANGDSSDLDDMEDEEYGYLLDIFKSEAAKMTYKLDKAAVNGDSATVSASITYVDGTEFLTKVFNDVITEALKVGEDGDEELFNQLMEQACKDNMDLLTGKTVTDDMVFELAKTDGEWKITNADSDVIANVLTVNMASIFADVAA